MKKLKRKRTTMDINSRLPQNIIEVILSKLPIPNFPTCRVVCNYWNELILNYVSSSSKIIPHTWFLCTRGHRMYCIDFDQNSTGRISFVASLAPPHCLSSRSFSIMCSCKGLLLIYTSNHKPMRLDILNPITDKDYYLGILNPMTNEYLNLPVDIDLYEDGILSRRHPRALHSYGFGFSLKTKRCKVVRVFTSCHGECSFEVFTFGGSNNQWRTCAEHVPFYIHVNGVYFNGFLYWIGLNIRGYVIEHVICCFDLENERTESITHLPIVVPTMREALETFNDSVYAIFLNPFYNIEVWRMQNCGTKDSWAREFVLKDAPQDWVMPSMYAYFKFIKCYEDGRILCLINYKFSILYNPKDGSIKILNQFEPPIPTFTSVCRLDSSNFSSLQKTLAGDDG